VRKKFVIRIAIEAYTTASVVAWPPRRERQGLRVKVNVVPGNDHIQLRFDDVVVTAE